MFTRSSKLRPAFAALVCSLSLSLTGCGDDATDEGDDGGSSEAGGDAGDGDAGSEEASTGDGDSSESGDGDSSTGDEDTSSTGGDGDGDGGDGDGDGESCNDAADCDDGLYCNGEEQCVDGFCAPAESPVVCGDDVDCTVDSCNEDTDSCESTPDDDACDSDAPFCVLEFGCVEATCQNDNDCNDFVFCNGLEDCSIPDGASVGACVLLSDPPSCDDNDACTMDVCDTQLDECTNPPVVCDNGLFCDGEETCDSVDGCQAGTPVPIDDGLECTDDSCDEVNDEVVHALSPACDNGADYDDDGDCFCESGVCTGSENPSCQSLSSGDCDDSLDSVNPLMADEPDLSQVDSNCDGIDGDEDDVVFLDPLDGNDFASGLVGSAPKKTLAEAVAVAQSSNRSWIVIGNEAAFDASASDFVEGVSFAGGYLPDTGWDRNSTLSTMNMPYDGVSLQGWSTDTEYQLLNIQIADAPATESSTGFKLVNSFNLTFAGCQVSGGRGGDGANGAPGADGVAGGAGADGAAGCENDGNQSCEECSAPAAGGGGTSAVGNTGGAGGAPGQSDNNGTGGSAGGGPGGSGGSAGVHGTNNGDGGPGNPGSPGDDGSDGSGATGLGTWSTGGYTPKDGQDGTAGVNGTGGGGGGGGAGGDSGCDSFGGGGGGGGGGGSGGGGGEGGGGGGASVIFYLNNSAISVVGGTYLAADGGNGGDGAAGGLASNGGLGEDGGVGEDDSGAGGKGGDGGSGGAGGGGGGGLGGPSYVAYCDTGGQVTQSNAPNVTPANGGVGGTGVSNGADGVAGLFEGCN